MYICTLLAFLMDNVLCLGRGAGGLEKKSKASFVSSENFCVNAKADSRSQVPKVKTHKYK